ncbi:N-acetylglucosamine kinase [Fulvivirga sp. M361]|uniref:N-acetylglucosamine kinase n=1 Tax=Fulvivirga sp. M361 TaxID=2594266 RepID=UPI00117BAB40|nr:N-acetylglucosamine kinase [Fulvivirga sp. M361]TRX48617.1 N-acetylglucosamine kinase [Fulvivirga sp. M361]
MWLFADSGSTKTDWRLVNQEGELQVSVETEGLNPYFLTDHEISNTFQEKVCEKVYDVEGVFFYGAGCGKPAKANQVKRALKRTLPSSCSVEVAGDILAAARGSLQGQPGISCILGTGANSCIYNGKMIIDSAPSLGYMLSDWGSGTVMCKDFLGLLFQQKLPQYMIEDFLDTYELTTVQVLDKIYNQPLANRFLASFSPFLLKYAEEAAVTKIITQNFKAFFNYYVLRYPQLHTVKSISVVGSIGYYYQKYLLQVADELGISIHKILKNPMDGLVEFHCSTIHVNH